MIGIDYSYTCPAICILGENFEASEFFFATTKKKLEGKIADNIHGYLLPDYSSQTERFSNICNWAMSHIDAKSFVFIEGYSYGSRVGQIFDIAENTSLLKYEMWKKGINFTKVAPTEAKKFWTGKGNANKDLMVKTLLDKEGIDVVSLTWSKKVESPASDIVDSYVIASFGKYNYVK